MLRVDYLALRKALGWAEDQKYVSPAELGQARFRDPQTGRETSFLLWAEELRRSEDGLSALERKAVELADNYWAYQDHRSGRRLGLLPDPNSSHEQWWSLAGLMRSGLH